MIIQSPDNTGLAIIAMAALRITNVGKQIIDSHPMAAVKLISSQSDPKTYFQAIGGKNHTVHLSEADCAGLQEFLQDHTKSEFAESVASLAHELIHAAHSLEDHAAFKIRNQSDPISHAFDNQEEELTIKGMTCGVKSPKICENQIRAELELEPRTSH